jgi:hypothetical protein
VCSQVKTAHRATRSSRVIATGGRSTSGQERALGTRSGGLDERLAELLSALGACTHTDVAERQGQAQADGAWHVMEHTASGAPTVLLRASWLQGRRASGCRHASDVQGSCSSTIRREAVLLCLPTAGSGPLSEDVRLAVELL